MAATVGPPSSAGGGAPATVTIDKHLDLERLAERARADADVARFHLHAALSELVELQSDVLHLQREASILHEQLQDTATTGAGAASPAAITTRGDLLAAVYRTERIRSKVASLDDLRNDIAAAEFRGQQLEHVHARLATEIVDGRKVSRDLGEVLAEEKKKAGDLNRREIEVARNLSAAKARLEQLRKEHATHIGSLRQTVHDHREALMSAKQSNASLESQIHTAAAALTARASPRALGAKVRAALGGNLPPPSPTAASTGGNAASRSPPASPTMRSILKASGGYGAFNGAGAGAGDPAAAAAAAAADAADAEEVAMVETLRKLGIRAADLAGAASGTGVRSPTGHATGGPPSPRHAHAMTKHDLGSTLGRNHGRSSSPSPPSPRRDRHGLGHAGADHHDGDASRTGSVTDVLSTVDPDALVMLCLQHDEAHMALHSRVEAEEARVAALLRQLQSLNSIAVEDASAAGGLADDSASSSGAIAAAGTGTGRVNEGALVRAGAGAATARPMSASSSASASGTVSVAGGTAVAGRIAGLGGWERPDADIEAAAAATARQLQHVTAEKDWLMQTVMPVRLGLASWARRLLGMSGATIVDAEEAHAVLSRLTTMCAGLVDEVRRTMAAEDPDSTAGVDWPALMAEELAEALAAVHAQAAEASVAVAARDATAGARAAFNDATSAFVSPFNIRVPATKGPGGATGGAGAVGSPSPGPAGASRSGTRTGPGMVALLQIVEAHRAAGGLGSGLGLGSGSASPRGAAGGGLSYGLGAGAGVGASFGPGALPSPLASDSSLAAGGRSVTHFGQGGSNAGQRLGGVAGGTSGFGVGLSGAGGSSRDRFDPGLAAAVAGVAAATTAAAAGTLAPLAIGGGQGRRTSHGGDRDDFFGGDGALNTAGAATVADDDDATTGLGVGGSGAGATAAASAAAAAHAADDDEDGGVPNRADLKRQAQRLLRRMGAGAGAGGAGGAASGSGSPVDSGSSGPASRSRVAPAMSSSPHTGHSSNSGSHAAAAAASGILASSSQRAEAGRSGSSTASLVAQLAEHAAASLAAARTGSAGAPMAGSLSGKGNHAHAAGIMMMRGSGPDTMHADALRLGHSGLPPGRASVGRGALSGFSASDGPASASASMPTLPLTRSQLQRALATGRGGRRGAM